MDVTKYKNHTTRRNLFLFAGNNAATGALYVIISGFFLTYGTNVYDLDILVLGVIMTLTRLLDAVTDPFIGVLVDKTNTKWGRYRPWMIVGSVIMNIAFVLLFLGADFGSVLGNYIWIIFTYVLWVIGYTFQTTVTKAGQTALTNVPEQRTKLNAISGIYQGGIFLVVYTLLIPLIKEYGGFDSRLSWQVLSYIMIGIQFFFTTISIFGIAEKDKPEFYIKKEDEEKPSIKQYVTLFKRNKALQMLIVAASTNKTALTMVNGLLVYFYFYVAQDVDMQSKVTPTMALSTAIGLILYIIITKRIGRKKEFLYASFAAIFYAPIAILLVTLSPTPTPFLPLALVFGLFVLFNSMTELNIVPMIGDASDYEYYMHGKNVPGMIGTAFSFFDKLFSSFATLINAAILSLLGYVSFEETLPNSTMFWGILLTITIVPSLGHLASVIAMKYYPITSELLEKINLKEEV